jgi:hypothetical protein
MLLIWQLLALAGFLMAVHAGKQYWIHKAIFHLFSFIIFLTLSIGLGFIGYLYSLNCPLPVLEPLWAMMTVIIALLLIPVFYSHFDKMAADHGGFCMEAGIILMVVGLIVVTTGDFHVILWIGMLSLTLFYIGYIRLRALVQQH